MRVGIAGLGVVGAASVDLLRKNADLLAGRAGQAITIVAVSARDKGKKRDCDLSGLDWVDDLQALAKRSDVDVIVDAMGGIQEEAALAFASAALANGKHFVTANKALIAARGVELARMAEKAKLQLSFEAAVCGGVPVLKMLREGLAGNRISSVRGILNGTCNYILTRMFDENLSFNDALGEAQKRGYAEADPAADIDGHDAANKLAILSALAFGVAPDCAAIFVEGIRNVTGEDLKNADARGGRVKLLGIAERTAEGIVQRVQPVFVPLAEPLARVGGSGNMIEITGDCAEVTRVGGLGAGAATASSIIADLVDIARGHRSFAFGVPAADLEAGKN